MIKKFVVAIDQGTTSCRSIVFNEDLQPIGVGQKELTQYFPNPGWVEHDPEEIWSSTLEVFKESVGKAGIDFSSIATVGITNQRETVVVWDRLTGHTVGNAIVWQDRRTFEFCNSMRDDNIENEVINKTGLLLDPYFSGSKIKWILDEHQGMRKRAESGNLIAGTIDSFLIWRLTGGKHHVTDSTNAARTQLFNIREHCWDSELLELFAIPKNMLPEVKDCADSFGSIDPNIFGTLIPINGVAGDQHAATIGQACFSSGMMKTTYGTGCFALLNTGETCVLSKNRLLTTIAYRIRGKSTFALEGSIFVAGAVIQWLRDGLKIIKKAEESENLAIQARSNSRVYLVPAFTGLGAPYWDAECRGAIFGLTRDTGYAEITRAALRSVGYQTRDLFEAMKKDQSDYGIYSGSNNRSQMLRVDGGMVKNDWMVQSLSDILQIKVDRPSVVETTSMGTAWLAGMHIGIFPEEKEFEQSWELDKRFSPLMDEEQANNRYKGWLEAVGRVLSH